MTRLAFYLQPAFQTILTCWIWFSSLVYRAVRWRKGKCECRRSIPSPDSSEKRRRLGWTLEPAERRRRKSKCKNRTRSSVSRQNWSRSRKLSPPKRRKWKWPSKVIHLSKWAEWQVTSQTPNSQSDWYKHRLWELSRQPLFNGIKTEIRMNINNMNSFKLHFCFHIIHR